MEQKIIQIGNSTGLIIPKTILTQLGFQEGSFVVIELDQINEGLIITKRDAKQKKRTINPRFLETLDKVNKQYAKALEELARG
jgi:putative addiction module antidote